MSQSNDDSDIVDQVLAIIHERYFAINPEEDEDEFNEFFLFFPKPIEPQRQWKPTFFR